MPLILLVVVRRTLASDQYCKKIMMARDANKARRTRRECAILLTTRCRMALDHSELHRHVEKYNLLRRLVRTRIAEEKYHEKVQAAAVLQRHLRSIAAQVSQSLALRLPLKRHMQTFLDATRLATVLQASCRRWCMESMGQHSQVEIHSETGKGRIKLCMDQSRDAAVELQLNVRRLLSNCVDERIEPPGGVRGLARRGYARVLTATELLHAQMRRCVVRTLIVDLMSQYGIRTLQAQVRRRRVRKAYGKELEAHSMLVYPCRRALVTRWYIRSEWAQKKLQAYAKMTTTPPPDLKYSQMPTRELAKFMQGFCRGALARSELVRAWDAALTLQTLIRCRLHRLLYLQSKAWSKKATSGNSTDAHKFFGSLTSTKAKGTHMWRTRQYLERNKERGPFWKTAEFPATATSRPKDVKAVNAVRYVTTEARRQDIETVHMRETVENRVHTEAERYKNGCLLNLQIPSGSRRILAQGRIVQSLSCNQIIIDPLTSSEIEDEYRHFFLENNGFQRRIIKYTPDRVVTVLPPFDLRPIPNTMYYIVDLEETPIEPNLVKIRRERMRRAATALQYAFRYYTAKKILRKLKWEREDAERKKLAYEAIQRAYEQELERARQKVLAEDARRMDEMREGRRMLQHLQDAQDAQDRQKQEEEDARRARLWGLTPKAPVAPARPQVGEGVSPSPRRRQIRSISSASYSQLMGATPHPEDEADNVAKELRRRIAFENSQLELTLHEEREGAYSRGSSVTLECDADSESAPFHSLNYVRQHVRKVNHALHVDRSPPKLDRETSEALEALNDKVAAGEITREEAATLQKKLMKTWKMSPKTSPRERLNLSQQFDLSPRHL
jgi:hypothetical protein